MSRFSQLTDAEREYVREVVKHAPPLTDRQKSAISAAFNGIDLGWLFTPEPADGVA